MRLNGVKDWNGLLIFAVLALMGLLCYGRVISYPFVHDDIVFIVNNPHIKSLNLFDIFRPRVIDTAAPELVNTYYRPIIELVHRLQYRLFGLQPHGYHLTNIVLHITNAFLLFKLFVRWSPVSKGMSFCAAVLFLVHPIQTEAVTCISGISNVLLLTLMLTSFCLYLDATRQGAHWKYGAALAVFFVGCFVKEQMIVLPFVIGLFEWVMRQRKKQVFGYLVPLALYFVLRKLILGFSTTVIFDSNGEYWLRLAAIPRSLLNYLSLMVFPTNLHYYRSLDVLESNILATVVIGVLAIVGALGMLKMRSVFKPYVLFGLGWIFLTLAPMLNIIPLVNEHSSILNFEHFLYVPLVGMSLIVCCLGVLVGEQMRISAKALTTIVVGILMVFSILTIRQNGFWQSEITLFERTLKYQNSARVRILLGKAYYFDKRYQDAIEQYHLAFQQMREYMDQTSSSSMQKFYSGFIKEIYFDLAHCYEALKNHDQAIKMYLEGINMDPDDVNFYNNLAVLYIKQQDYPSAIRYLEQAMALNPNNPMTRQNLAYCLVQVGQKSKADQLMQNERVHP